MVSEGCRHSGMVSERFIVIFPILDVAQTHILGQCHSLSFVSDIRAWFLIVSDIFPIFNMAQTYLFDTFWCHFFLSHLCLLLKIFLNTFWTITRDPDIRAWFRSVSEVYFSFWTWHKPYFGVIQYVF